MIRNLLLSVFALYSFQICSQNFEPGSLAECSTDQIELRMLENPEYVAKRAAFEEFVNSQRARRNMQTQPNFVIPVVVHIMHLGEPLGTGTNLSDQTIYTAIKRLNENFRKIPGSLGDGDGVDTQIEFALAVRDPLGECTNAINRVDMSFNPTYFESGVGSEGVADSYLKAQSFWDSNQYYNIWVVSEITDAAGYAYLASSHGNSWDGTVISALAFSGLSRTLTHELGHAMNLHHTFEGDMNGTACPVGNGCGSSGGDCCGDTPPHMRGTNCNTTTPNACDGNSSPTLHNRNYLDYYNNSCRNMFTANQGTRMGLAIEFFRSSFLPENGNLSLVSPIDQLEPTYTSSSSGGCVGTTVTFTDQTPCVPTTYLADTSAPGFSFNWTFTNGNNVLTSSMQNPTITFNVPGIYNLTYTIANATGEHMTTVPNAIIIVGEPVAACIPDASNAWDSNYTVNNVSFNTINHATSTLYNEQYSDYTCSQATTVTAGQMYPLSVSIKAGAISTEQMEAYIDYNSNGIFEASELLLSGSTPPMTTAVISGNIIIPATAVQSVPLRMRIIGEAGTISAAERSCTVNYNASDVEDYTVLIQPELGLPGFNVYGLTYWPNPTADVLQVQALERIEKIIVYDNLGRVVHQILPKNLQMTLNMSHLSDGIYMVSVFAESSQSNFKIVKQ